MKQNVNEQLLEALNALFNQVSVFKFDFPPVMEKNVSMESGHSHEAWEKAFKAIQAAEVAKGNDPRFWIPKEQLARIKASEVPQEPKQVLYTFTFLGGGYNQVHGPINATPHQIVQLSRKHIGKGADEINLNSIKALSEEQAKEYWKNMPLMD